MLRDIGIWRVALHWASALDRWLLRAVCRIDGHAWQRDRDVCGRCGRSRMVLFQMDRVPTLEPHEGKLFAYMQYLRETDGLR